MPPQITVLIPMDAPGWAISKNNLWRGGNRRYGMNSVAKGWKATLAASLAQVLRCEHSAVAEHLCLPVHIVIACRFIDKGHALDPANIIELVQDSVEEGLKCFPGKWNDRDFTVETKANEYAAERLPEIAISVSIGVQEVGG